MPTSELKNSYQDLIAWLRSQRDSILSEWRRSVRGDESEKSARQLSRSQLIDHIPQVLDDYERSLRELAQTGSEGDMQNAPGSSDHGLHRWQQGYELHELTKEWGHLHLCLLARLETYSSFQRDLAPQVMSNARRVLAELCIEGVCNSTARYFDLHRREAEGHVKDLEGALRDLNELERRRAELWRSAAHDLRGSVAAVKSATTLISRKNAEPSAQEQFESMLNRSVTSLQQMLTAVIDFSRLQAGREQVSISDFEAGDLLREVGERFTLLAEERGLWFRIEGADVLNVQGDPSKVARIAQNLILNAINYTLTGGITLTWGALNDSAAIPKWFFSVNDTGPGILAGPGSPLTEVMKEATDLVRESEGKAPTSSPTVLPAQQHNGEGIGLSIVKGLCNLLDATIELEAAQQGGTCFRIILPADYNARQASSPA